ncbi:MAG: hypothetical protein AAFY88_14075, partial [Acidobacteriota bacterium]
MVSAPIYDDFVLAIQPKAVGGFEVRVGAAPRGSNIKEACDLPFRPEEFSQCLAEIRSLVTSSGTYSTLAGPRFREIVTADDFRQESSFKDAEHLLSDFGKRLFASIATGEVGYALRSC